MRKRLSDPSRRVVLRDDFQPSHEGNSPEETLYLTDARSLLASPQAVRLRVKLKSKPNIWASPWGNYIAVAMNKYKMLVSRASTHPTADFQMDVSVLEPLRLQLQLRTWCKNTRAGFLPLKLPYHLTAKAFALFSFIAKLNSMFPFSWRTRIPSFWHMDIFVHMYKVGEEWKNRSHHTNTTIENETGGLQEGKEGRSYLT